MRIVFLVVDSLRTDAPGFSGGRCKTPTLDRIAREGAVLEATFTCSPWTVPSTAAMMTGVYAHRLGLYRWEQPWPGEFLSIFGLLAGSGYHVASFVFDSRHLFRSVPEAQVRGCSQEPDAVIEWLDRCTENNLFLFIHYWGTHFPYLDRKMSMKEWKELSDRIIRAMNIEPASVVPKVRMLYRRAVERMSERFMPGLMRAASRHAGPGGTLVVLTSDHGESWGERNPEGTSIRDIFDFHGNNLYEESMRVPLVFWGLPWMKRGKISGLARTVDLAPTLLEIAGGKDSFPCSGEAGIDGRPLLRRLASGEGEASSSALAAASADFLEGPGHPSCPEELWVQFAMRTERWKYIWSPRCGERFLFDLEEDPGEKKRLPEGSGEPREPWEELAAEQERSRCAPPCLPEGPAGRRLKGLGYIE